MDSMQKSVLIMRTDFCIDRLSKNPLFSPGENKGFFDSLSLRKALQKERFSENVVGLKRKLMRLSSRPSSLQ